MWPDCALFAGVARRTFSKKMAAMGLLTTWTLELSSLAFPALLVFVWLCSAPPFSYFSIDCGMSSSNAGVYSEDNPATSPSPIPSVSTIQTVRWAMKASNLDPYAAGKYLCIPFCRSPIWSVPGFSEGHLNMVVSPLLATPEIPPIGQVGRAMTSSPYTLLLLLQVVTIPTASPDALIGDGAAEKVGVSIQQHFHAGSRTVLAKPLRPNQTLPSSIATNLVSMGNPSPVTCKC